jgi:hypothetical protein
MVVSAYPARLVMVACLVALLGGCAPSTQLATNRARDYKGNHRTFIAKSAQLAKETFTGLELEKNEYLVVWRAKADSEALATDVTDKIKADGVLTCGPGGSAV